MASAEARTERMRSLLKRVLREEGVTLSELGRHTGRSVDYWSKMFRGRYKLHAEHVYQALAVAGVAPQAFFARLHGGRSAAGPPPAALDEQETLMLLGEAVWAAQVIVGLAVFGLAAEGPGAGNT